MCHGAAYSPIRHPRKARSIRSYPRNSPQAAARLVVLTLLAELNALLREEVASDLGLSTLRLDDLVREVSEDLLSTGFGAWSNGQALDDAVAASVLSKISDPALRERVLARCLAVAHADGHVSEGEHTLLDHASRRWGLAPVLAR